MRKRARALQWYRGLGGGHPCKLTRVYKVAVPGGSAYQPLLAGVMSFALSPLEVVLADPGKRNNSNSKYPI